MRNETTVTQRISSHIQISIAVANDGSYAVATTFVYGHIKTFDIVGSANVFLPDYMDEKMRELDVKTAEYLNIRDSRGKTYLVPSSLEHIISEAKTLARWRAQ